MGVIDTVRARAHAALERVPGKVGDRLRGINESLGRPLAADDELQDRRAFEAKTAPGAAPVAAKPPAQAAGTSEAAPVIVYHMEKSQRDVPKVTDILDTQGIPYKVMNIQDDPAAQYAVRRDSNGIALPVVFVAGECVGGRAELVNAASSGELKRKVFE